jgi:hypothetical protein
VNAEEMRRRVGLRNLQTDRLATREGDTRDTHRKLAQRLDSVEDGIRTSFELSKIRTESDHANMIDEARDGQIACRAREMVPVHSELGVSGFSASR